MNKALPRVLGNIGSHQLKDFVFRDFSHYTPAQFREGKQIPYAANKERRSLKEILSTIPENEFPDIVLIQSPEYLPIPYDIANFSGIKILLITDWNVCLRFLPEVAKFFDFCFTDAPGCEILHGAGLTNIFPQALFGHFPECFYYQDKKRDIDISFCGNLNTGLHRDRNRLLQRVARLSSKYRIFIGNAYGEQYLDILNRSHLVFNYAIRREANMRTYEAMACGAIPLIEESNLEVPLLFNKGEHFLNYSLSQIEDSIEKAFALADRFPVMSMCAREEVAKHTFGTQLNSLLLFSCQQMRRSLPPMQDKSTLTKIRVLGYGYTLAEALSEINDQHNSKLKAEAIPSLLLQALEIESSSEIISRLLLQNLQTSLLPEHVREFGLAKMAWIEKRYENCLEHTEKNLSALQKIPLVPIEKSDPGYCFFYAPIELAKGLNTDLNHAFAEDLFNAAPTAYLQLFTGLCLLLQAQCHLALEQSNQAIVTLNAIPHTDFFSLEKEGLLIEILQQQKAGDTLRDTLKLWFIHNPFNPLVWEKVLQALHQLGDAFALHQIIQEILLLGKNLLSEEEKVQWSKKYILPLDLPKNVT